MKKTQRTLKENVTTKKEVLHLAFELSQDNWKLGFSDGQNVRFKNVTARNLDQFQEEIEKAREHFKLNEHVRMVSCYEAGRDGKCGSGLFEH